ncbi:MAG TPA: RNA 2',3'-cyclic phosphodiesterase [Pyrinomonadaceae bacterium]|jgi:2'-5' RNA ligase
MSTPAPPVRLRLFCAVELPTEVRAHAHAHSTRLRATAPQVKASWERPEKLHITIKFFGDIEAARVPALTDAATRAAASVAPFELTLAGTGAFPGGHNPRVLWLGVQDAAGQLALLQQRLEAECAAAGFPRELRDFHAHLTLARLRMANAAARRLAHYHEQLGFTSVPFQVSELLTMQSTLAPGGSQYTTLARHALRQ